MQYQDTVRERRRMLAEAAEAISRASTPEVRTTAERIHAAISAASDEEIATAAAQMARLRGAA